MSDIRKDIEKIKQLLLKKSNCDCENPSGGGGGSTSLMEDYLRQIIDIQTSLLTVFNQDFVGQNVVAKGFTATVSIPISVGDIIDLEYSGNIDIEKIKSLTIINDDRLMDLVINIDIAVDNLILKPGVQYKWNGSNNGTFGYGAWGQTLYNMNFAPSDNDFPVTIYFEEISMWNEDGTGTLH